MGKYLMIEHIEAHQKQLKEIFKLQPEAFCPEIRAVITGKLYQYGGRGFKTSQETYKLYGLLEDGILKNWDKIQDIWLRLEHKQRAKKEINYIKNDPCFQKALVKYKTKLVKRNTKPAKQSRILTDILNELQI